MPKSPLRETTLRPCQRQGCRHWSGLVVGLLLGATALLGHGRVRPDGS